MFYSFSQQFRFNNKCDFNMPCGNDCFSEKNQEYFTKTENWQNLKDAHELVHGGVQNYINEDAQNSINNTLKNISVGIEDATYKVFQTLDQVKIDHKI